MKEEIAIPCILGFVAAHELIITLALSPLFLFPNRASILGLVVIAGVWIARRAAYGRLTRSSSMSIPAILLALMAVIGTIISVDRGLSEPKLWGILFQIILFFAVLNGLRNRRAVHLLSWGIILLTIGVSLISLIGTDWDIVRLAQFPQLYNRLPQLIRNIPDSGISPGQDLFHPREVGATMGMLLPFITSILLFGHSRWIRLVSLVALLVGGIVLLLSQAIMGLFGLLIGWALLAVWWRRWMLVPILIVAFGFAGFVFLSVPDNWRAILLSIDNSIGIAVILRLDIWSRALAMIADMPYTGIGLNTFPLIQSHFYIGHLIGPEPHAHNLLLQTAVDLGVPGLAAFIWLVAAFYVAAFQADKRVGDRQLQVLIIGAVAGVTAYVAGGAIDVMTLGAKPVAALSMFLGLVGALSWLSSETRRHQDENMAGVRKSRFIGLAGPALLLLALALGLVFWPSKAYSNRALIPAHQAIYAARRTGGLPEIATTQALELLPRAIARDPDNPELYGVYGAILAWRDEPASAIDALAQRVDLDGRDPFRYAPFLNWQNAVFERSEPNNWQNLLQIYRQWQARFPERADIQVLVSLIHERHLEASDRAAAIQRQALDAGATPRSLSEFYYQLLLKDLE